jgi:EAL domain-containing protein (putative c-di-GMP-specific phosphodiesterase class I)
VDASRICFEITETAAVTNLTDATHLITALKEEGFRFALDDFGSGLSSFNYLKHLPVDYLKIDGSFVKDLMDDPIDYAMVESINQIGHILKLKTIAEFVENSETLQILKELKVDYAQGYAIHKPQLLSFENKKVVQL